jgi:hypothetical protein
MDEARKRLERFIGEWTMRATFPGAPPVEGGLVVFEWMTGERFLIQRWEVPVPEAPDGLAVIGFDDSRGTLLQHYFDSRGIARVYAMSLEDGVWTLWRETPDFSPWTSRSATRGRSVTTARRSLAAGRSPTTAPPGSTTLT